MEELEALKEKRPKLACLLHLGLMQHEPLTTCQAGARTMFLDSLHSHELKKLRVFKNDLQR